MKTIKKPDKKQENQNNLDKIFNVFLSLSPTEITIFGAIFLGAGIFLQFSLIGTFLGIGLNAIYLVNIQSAILFTFSFILYLILSILFPFLFIIAFIISLIGYFTNYNLSQYIIITYTYVLIIGLLLLIFKSYREFIVKIFKSFLSILLILSTIGLYFIIYLSSKTYNEIEINTQNESFTGKLFFSNGENYFIEKDGKKIILPIKEVKSIEFLTGSSK